MTTQEIIGKLWNLCHVLRDDGITYHQYVTELTYLLFLKMLAETEQEEGLFADIREKYEAERKALAEAKSKEVIEKKAIESYSWSTLSQMQGIELKNYYKKLLLELGEAPNGMLRQIYHDARTDISEPKNLKKLISNMDELDWYSAKTEGLGDLYEGLLEKNASEKKSGAGQYFTPRPLIDVMVELTDPQLGEKCNDPACGTFGFMIAAFRHVLQKNGGTDMDNVEAFRKMQTEDFSGIELVSDTQRLALMNAILHDMKSEVRLGDTLTSLGEELNQKCDVVLANPPFGTKKGGEKVTRSDFLYETSNKQLNFLQHIYRSLKTDGKARAAVVFPDNVLFADNDGTSIRRELMDKCDLHTILRLPTGIFYAQGVKTNVLFFRRGTEDQGNTKGVWVYDLRTNMPNFGKTNPLKKEHFEGFVKAYQAEDRSRVENERWNYFTREQITEKGGSLDLGLIRDDSLVDYEDLPDPIESGEEIIGQLEEAVDLMKQVIRELSSPGGKE